MTGAQAGKNAVENNYLAIIRTGAAACAEIPACTKAVVDIGLGALVGIGVATSALENLSSTQKTNVMLAAISGDPNLIDNLSAGERVAYEEWKGNHGLITVFPVGEKNLTGDKLVNPAQDEKKETSLITPDQSGRQGASNTGHTEGAPDTGGNTTVTPIPEQNKDDLAYLVEGRDNRLPIPEPTIASNGFKIESNPKHTPGATGSRPSAGVEPKNSLSLFDSSIATKDPKIRLSIDSDGNIHRFFNTSKDGSGTYHWSGSTGDDKNALGNRELGSFNKEIKELKGRK